MTRVCDVLVAALVLVGLLILGGSTLLLDAWWNRPSVDLADS
jgi:hypothetical protein